MEQYNTTQQRDDCLIRPSQQLDDGELALYFISLVIICIFVLEILSAFYAFGWRRYTKILFLLDAIIVLTSFILEVYFHFGNALKAGRASAALVVLRMWKVVRAIHAIAHSISLRNHMIVEKIKEAETTLQEEIAEAEKTILEQKNKINDLTNLLEKTGTQTNPEQIDGFTRKRTKSFNSVTRF
jgi:cell division protein FtsL